MKYAVLNKTEGESLLRDFYTLSGLRTVLFDNYGRDTLSYPASLPEFCRLVRSTRQGEEACLQCDQTACRRARTERRPVVYTCHSGLTEVIMPLRAGEETIGYFLLCHIVQEDEREQSWERCRERCAPYVSDEAVLRAAWDELPRVSGDFLRASSSLLLLAAHAVIEAQMVRVVSDSMTTRLEKYVDDHLEQSLTSERICTALGVSRTALYHLATDAYGCGISEYITRRRIRRAQELLIRTNQGGVDICNQCGFNNYNYFIRVFKKQTGFTPKMYRKQFAERDSIGECVELADV